MEKEKILAIIGVIGLVICFVLAGMVDAEARLYLVSTPKGTRQSQTIER